MFGFGHPARTGLRFGLVELGVELLEGVGLVGEPGVGVDVRGYGDVGVAEELLHGDQGDAGLYEQGRAGVSEVVEPDLPHL